MCKFAWVNVQLWPLLLEEADGLLRQGGYFLVCASHCSCTREPHLAYSQTFLTTHSVLGTGRGYRIDRGRGLCSRVMSEQGNRHMHTYIDRREVGIKGSEQRKMMMLCASHTGDTVFVRAYLYVWACVSMCMKCDSMVMQGICFPRPHILAGSSCCPLADH